MFFFEFDEFGVVCNKAECALISNTPKSTPSEGLPGLKTSEMNTSKRKRKERKEEEEEKKATTYRHVANLFLKQRSLNALLKRTGLYKDNPVSAVQGEQSRVSIYA